MIQAIVIIIIYILLRKIKRIKNDEKLLSILNTITIIICLASIMFELFGATK